jgi:hypothetical protein
VPGGHAAGRATALVKGDLPVSRDVDDVAVWCSDEGARYAPLLGGQLMHDLVAALLRLGMGDRDVVDPDRDLRRLNL